MQMRVLSKEAALRLMELSQKPYRPAVIIKLNAQIEAETRIAELRKSITGTLDMEAVQKIVQMKLELDRLFALWAEGKIE